MRRPTLLELRKSAAAKQECNMERQTEQRAPIDLGAASEQTLGTGDRAPDLVGQIPEAGISDD